MINRCKDGGQGSGQNKLCNFVCKREGGVFKDSFIISTKGNSGYKGHQGISYKIKTNLSHLCEFN